MKTITTFGLSVLAIIALPFLDNSEINFHTEFSTNESQSAASRN